MKKDSNLFKTFPIKCCIRCGISQEEVKMFKIGCKVWGMSYKRHKYKTFNLPL